MGRPWDAFFIFPYFPNQRGPLWVNFRSPLVWDVFAISTYFTISLVFWYLGMIPDLATLRDRARRPASRSSSSASSAWAGTARSGPGRATRSSAWCSRRSRRRWCSRCTRSSAWTSPRRCCPGWHTTIFPPYFVAGAIFSGFGMVLTLLIITRQTMHLERYITVHHLDAMAKVTLLTGSLVGYAYATEFFIAWYRRQPLRAVRLHQPRHRPVRLGFYLMVLCNVLTPQLFWCEACAPQRRRCCSSLSILVNVGMWFERFVIIVVVAAPRLPAVELGDVLSDGDRHRHPGRQLRPVLHLFLLFIRAAADDRHVGGQGGVAQIG